MASFNKKNMADIICNYKKTMGKKIKYAIDFASTQLRIIRLHKYPIDPKAYLELCRLNIVGEGYRVILILV